MSTAADIQRIKRRLQRMKPSEVNEVKDFVEFVARKGSSEASARKIVKLRGIWKGKGFERIDVQKEIKQIRKEMGEGILRRAKKWNM